jgi:hypothetical protein
VNCSCLPFLKILFKTKLLVMKIRQIPIKQIDDDHEIWLKELDNHWNEIVGFRHRLIQLSKMNNCIELTQEQLLLEMHFQRLENEIERICDNIKKHLYSRSNLLSQHAIRTDEDYYGDHEDLCSEIQTFRQIYIETQKEYYDFMTRWR